MSYSLYCHEHDSKIFNDIEKGNINISNYKSQLLFSYRALCAELRKKEINIDIFNRIINSNILMVNQSLIDSAKFLLKGNKLGYDDMNYYKRAFEKEIFDNSSQNFSFYFFKFKFYPICASAVYSPIDPNVSNEDSYKKDNILNNLFVNIIPQNNELIILLGYHKEKCNDWIIKYIDSWNNITSFELSIKLTDLLSTKIETWAISPDYFGKINKKEMSKFKEYWNNHGTDLSINQKIDFNLFE